MRKGVILCEIKNRDFADRINEIAYKMKLYEIDDCRSLYEIDSDEEVCQLMRIHGVGFVVALLDKITKRRMKGALGHRTVVMKLW